MNCRGDRLHAALGFQAAALRTVIVKASERLVAADRNLNLLRVAEARSWQGYCGSASPDVAAAREAEAVVDSRHAAVREAIAEAIRCDEGISGLAAPLAEAERELDGAKEAFELARAQAEAAARSEPRAAEAEELAARYSVRAAQARIWAVEGRVRAREAEASYLADPVHAYLLRRGHGEGDAPRGWWPFTALDRALARATNFRTQDSRRRMAGSYPETSASWAEACEKAAGDLRAEAAAFRKEALEVLVPEREKLAGYLNRHCEIDGRHADLSGRRAEAVCRLVDFALARDPEWAEMARAFVSMVAREKKAALERAGGPGTRTDPGFAASIDRLSKERMRMSEASDSMRNIVARSDRALRQVEELQSKLALRRWHRPEAVFAIPSPGAFAQDLAEGRSSAEEAWNAVQSALRMPAAAADAFGEAEAA